MARTPRREVVDADEMTTVHVIQRCVLVWRGSGVW